MNFNSREDIAPQWPEAVQKLGNQLLECLVSPETKQKMFTLAVRSTPYDNKKIQYVKWFGWRPVMVLSEKEALEAEKNALGRLLTAAIGSHDMAFVSLMGILRGGDSEKSSTWHKTLWALDQLEQCISLTGKGGDFPVVRENFRLVGGIAR